MSTTIECPITIGGTYWIAAPIGERTRVTCPVCAGNKSIDIILGDGERVTVPCEGCGHGYDGPRGFIMELQQEPAARQVTVSRVSSMPQGDGGEWRFQTHDGWPVSESDLFATEGEAMAEAARRKAANDESNMKTRQRTRGRAKDGGWSVRYHREQIRDLERQIEWHRNRVHTAKETP